MSQIFGARNYLFQACRKKYLSVENKISIFFDIRIRIKSNVINHQSSVMLAPFNFFLRMELNEVRNPNLTTQRHVV